MFTKKLFLVPFVLLVTVGFVFAGVTGKISGRIVEKGSGIPLPGVNVVVQATTYGSTTDLEGNYFILNVPVGVHIVVASMIGYQTVEVEKVVVSSDLTTNLDLIMTQATLDLEPVVIVAEKPMIQKDVTASRTTRSSDEMMAMPVDNIYEVVNLTAGVVGQNFRGGRATEVVYLVDGASIMDPVAGQYRGSIPSDAVEELSTETGGFSAEYGNAQSGVISMVMKEGGDRYSGSLRYKTNDFGDNELTADEHLKNFQATFGGPIPFTKEKLPGMGMKFFTAFELYDTKSRFPHEDSTSYSYSGKLTYNLSEKHKLALSGFWNNQDYTDYRHLWKNTTYEDLWFTGDPAFAGWVDNGQLDTEDLNYNGVIDEGDNDVNGDGVVQSEDLNHDGSLSAYNMLDHTPEYERITNKFTLKWTHNLSARTFYEIQLDRYYTEYHANTNERINEDANGNGLLDMEKTIDIPYLNEYLDYLQNSGIDVQYQYLMWDNQTNPAEATSFYYDLNQNGIQDNEDLNNNGIWDWNYYGQDTDLFYDNDDDGNMDASSEDWNHDGILQSWEDINGNGSIDSDWMPWEDLPPIPTNAKDGAGFYQYANGYTFPRARWYNYDRTRWHIKGTVFSQINKYHQIKAGLEAEFMNIFDHEVDFASGGNVYGQNYTVDPRSQAAFIEDKMEFEGMIVKIGLRFDRFDTNYKNFPSDISDPVTDPVMGGEIKNPTTVPVKTYVSPRFSVAFPFSPVDKLRFTYDKYFQMPILRYAFRNLNFDFSGAFPLIGNANLDPERTTLYEIGWEHLLNDNLVFEAVGFYKDITGLTDVQQVYYSVTDWYGLYYNTDYGNVRGFELSLKKRGTWVSGSINYTYSVAKGKSSSSRQNYDTVWANNIVPTTEQFLDWDQRHTVNSNVMLRIPRGIKKFSYLEDSGISIIGQYGSGRPFTFDPKAGREVVVNNKRLPWTLRFDLRLDKRFQIGEYTSMLMYLQVNNVFDRQNVDADYFQFGGNDSSIDPAWYVQNDANGDGVPDNDLNGEYNDPEVWLPGREIRVGLVFEF